MNTNEILSKLKNITSDKFWYITKQTCVFSELCYVANILELWNDNQYENYETFFNSQKIKEPFAKYISQIAHRATINCSTIGLMTNSSAYSSKNLTEVYYKIKELTNSNFNDTSSYQNIIDSQIEKVNISTPYIEINPIMFLFKILIILGDIKREYKISLEEFKLFVATASSWKDYLNTVNAIIRYRTDNSYKIQFNPEIKKNVSDVRFHLLLQNHSGIIFQNKEISLDPKKINEIKYKLYLYETSEERFSSENLFRINNEIEQNNNINKFKQYLERININSPFNKIINSYKREEVSDIISKNSSTSNLLEINDISTVQKIRDLIKKENFDIKGNSMYSCYVNFYLNFLKYTPEINDKNGTPKQKIYFGAPGTGKSHKIKEDTGITDNNSIRTTFHPDSDYSTFVGCYKPIKDNNNITYEFVPQAFTKAYLGAWKLFAKAEKEGNDAQPYYLIIEEINRGNCAQIFGDIFQLLDRNNDGFSDYEITPDKDLEDYLAKELEDIELPQEYEFIKSGKKLKLPGNLNILATMNTSDQSLFPMDSAFKRRWDWVYIPIKDDKEDHYISCNDKKFDWWNFLKEVNDRIENLTHSEDKKLGYWFAKPDNGKGISEEKFLSKVIFYLWNDIFKDMPEDSNNIFKFREDGENDAVMHRFHRFFEENSSSLMEDFLRGLKLTPIEESNKQTGTEEEETENNDEQQ